MPVSNIPFGSAQVRLRFGKTKLNEFILFFTQLAPFGSAQVRLRFGKTKLNKFILFFTQLALTLQNLTIL